MYILILEQNICKKEYNYHLAILCLCCFESSVSKQQKKCLILLLGAIPHRGRRALRVSLAVPGWCLLSGNSGEVFDYIQGLNVPRDILKVSIWYPQDILTKYPPKVSSRYPQDILKSYPQKVSSRYPQGILSVTLYTSYTLSSQYPQAILKVSSKYPYPIRNLIFLRSTKTL